MPDLGAPIAQPIDLAANLYQSVHASENVVPRVAIPLLVAELLEPVLLDPEFVRELVENRDPDLALQLLSLERLLERAPVDRDLGRQPRIRLPEAEEVRILGIDLLHDHCDVLQCSGDVRGERIERSADVLLERHQVGCNGRRFATRKTVNIPKTKPPTCAKNATPPPCSG